MGDWSRAHICQCLNRLLTLRGNSTVTIAQEQRKSGEQFVESVLSLAHKLCQLGLCRGQIVAICAFNRLVFPQKLFLLSSKKLITFLSIGE